MEFSGVGIEYITHDNAVRLGVFAAFACGIVNDDSGLYIVTKNVEIDAVAFVLNGIGLHPNAPCHKLVALKYGRNPIENMVARFFNIVSHKIFKGQHTHNVHIARARYKV